MGIWGLNYVFSLEYIKLYLFMGYVVEDNQLWKLVSLDKDFFFFFFFFFLEYKREKEKDTSWGQQALKNG